MKRSKPYKSTWYNHIQELINCMGKCEKDITWGYQYQHFSSFDIIQQFQKIFPFPLFIYLSFLVGNSHGNCLDISIFGIVHRKSLKIWTKFTYMNFQMKPGIFLLSAAILDLVYLFLIFKLFSLQIMRMFITKTAMTGTIFMIISCRRA